MIVQIDMHQVGATQAELITPFTLSFQGRNFIMPLSGIRGSNGVETTSLVWLILVIFQLIKLKYTGRYTINKHYINAFLALKALAYYTYPCNIHCFCQLPLNYKMSE